MTSKPNVDLDYINHFKNAPKAKSPAFINCRGDNQYIWVYTRNAFISGAVFGGFFGTVPAIYYR